ncbi:hypothetical protein QYF36_005007 [Acer negundo]|nr:hypothetical protein QYF36_005007 [Acer negundo]
MMIRLLYVISLAAQLQHAIGYADSASTRHRLEDMLTQLPNIISFTALIQHVISLVARLQHVFGFHSSLNYGSDLTQH